MTEIQDHGVAFAQVQRQVIGRVLRGPPTHSPESMGQFRLCARVGRGGFGEVYKAYDPELDRYVALKVLNRRSATESTALLKHEAMVMARLSNPHVVQVHHADEHEGQRFIVMEYVDGTNLEQWLERAPTVEAIRAVFRGVGEGIAAAHRLDIVHRDLKPANILVDEHGHPKVADFGLARDATRDRREPHAARAADNCAGTPKYMAPEQRAGEPATPRSDQYTYCRMLEDALLGEPSTTPMGAQRRALSPNIRQALARGMDPDPARRWPDMPSLLAALERPSGARRGLRRLVLAVVATAALMLALRSPPSSLKANPCRITTELAEVRAVGWRARLEARPDIEYLRGFFNATIADWKAEASELCGSGQQQLRRRIACHQYRGKMIDDWLAAGQLPAASGYDANAPGQPARWAAHSLQRACPEPETSMRGAWLKISPARQHVTSQAWLYSLALLQVGRPEAALQTLDQFGSHFVDGVPPASFHLLRARALEAAGHDPVEVLANLHIAEDLAETQRDDDALVDARIEQTRVAIAQAQTLANHTQSRPSAHAPALTGRLLNLAENILRRRGGPPSEPHVRLLAARVELTNFLGQEEELRAACKSAVAAARHHGSRQVLAELLSNCAPEDDPVQAAAYDAIAVAVAPADDRLLAGLNGIAGQRAFARGDLTRAKALMATASEHQGRLLGSRSPAVAMLHYLSGQALLDHGESAAALADAGTAVTIYQQHDAPVQHGAALYLRSAIHLRLAAPGDAVKDARAAAEVVRGDVSHDAHMWSTIFNTGLAEALVADQQNAEAGRLITTLLRDLATDPSPDAHEQRDDLLLARVKLAHRAGHHRRVSGILARLDDPRFLAHDGFKRAEALVLRAGSPGTRAREAAVWFGEAAALYAQHRSDGAVALRTLRKIVASRSE